MAEYILTEKSKIVAIADAIRSQTGSSDPLSLDEIIIAVGGVIPEEPDVPDVPVEPDTPEEPEVPTGFALAAGTYQTGAIALAKSGDIEAAAAMKIKSWNELVADGDIEVSDNKLVQVNNNSSFGDYDNAVEVVIPEGITEIIDMEYQSIFAEGQVYGIVFPSSMTRIGTYALAGMGGPMTQVVFAPGSNLEEIGESAFYMNINETTIVLPRSLKKIGKLAFNYVYMCKIEFEGTVAEFESIEKGSGWLQDSEITSIKCSDGNYTATDYDLTEQY